MALAPCLLGYGDVAKMLHGNARSKREGNRYWEWIENYVADDYTQAVKTGSGELEPSSPSLSPNKRPTNTDCYRTARETRGIAIGVPHRRACEDLHTRNQGQWSRASLPLRKNDVLILEADGDWILGDVSLQMTHDMLDISSSLGLFGTIQRCCYYPMTLPP